METLPAAPGGGAETLAAAEEKAKAKRARKRSRYLSSDYDTAIFIDDHADDDISASPGKGEDEEEDAAALLLRLQEANLATADLLAALLRSAASPGDSSSQGPGAVDAGLLLRFFALHRASVLAADCQDSTTTTDHHHSKSKGTAASSPAAGHQHKLPNPCRAVVAVAAAGSAGEKQQDDDIAIGHAYAAHHIGPAPPPEDGPNKRKKKVTFTSDGYNAAATHCSAQHSASSATGHAYGHHIGPAAAQAGRKRGRKKKVAFALNAHNAAGSSAQPATGIANAFNSAPKKLKKNKARSSSGQGQHPGKPVALLLDFAKWGTAAIHPPSKDDLLSTFHGFGSLIESHTEFTTRRARLVFGCSAAAEAAYSCAHTLGTFCNRRLQYLRPPPPAPKIPLADVRKNLEKMISSLTGPSSLGGEGALDLAGQMLRLMAKVDKTLCAAGAPEPSIATAAHHRH